MPAKLLNEVSDGTHHGKTFTVMVHGDDVRGQTYCLANVVVAYSSDEDEARLVGLAPPEIPNDLIRFLIDA
jgi:hypothetical protein